MKALLVFSLICTMVALMLITYLVGDKIMELPLNLSFTVTSTITLAFFGDFVALILVLKNRADLP